MCVIMQPKDNEDIPFADLESACTVNPDGYGIALVNDGRIEIMRGYDSKGNNAENIHKLLEDMKDKPKLIHLRFATQGDKNLDNCHPFEVLNKDSDGVDVALCHNGTFYGYPSIDASKSDTWHINEQLYKPLFTRFAKAVGPENVLADPLLQDIIEKYRPGNSLLSFLDSYGNVLNFGKGEEMPWGWASNKYSFNSSHRKPAVTTYGNSNNISYGGRGYASNYDEWGFNNTDYAVVEDTKDKKKDLSIKHINTIENKLSPAPSVKLLDEIILPRKTFVEIGEINNLRQLVCLEPADIEEIIYRNPEDAITLIMDLLHELYLKESAEKHKAAHEARKSTSTAVVPYAAPKPTTPEMGGYVENVLGFLKKVP